MTTNAAYSRKIAQVYKYHIIYTTLYEYLYIIYVCQSLINTLILSDKIYRKPNNLIRVRGNAYKKRQFFPTFYYYFLPI